MAQSLTNVPYRTSQKPKNMNIDVKLTKDELREAIEEFCEKYSIIIPEECTKFEVKVETQTKPSMAAVVQTTILTFQFIEPENS